jgi:L-asparaginase II
MLASTVSPEYYARRREEVLAVIDQTLASRAEQAWQQSADLYVERRHFAQNLILAKLKETSALAIATVRDGMDRILAIPYFTVDLVLLRQLAAHAAAVAS